MTHIRRAHGSPRQLSTDEVIILRRHVQQIVDAIAEDWPVDTSTSRDAFTFTLLTQKEDIGFVIENDTDYVQYIHRAGEPPTPPLWETLIPDVVRAFAPDLNQALKVAIDANEKIYQATGDKRTFTTRHAWIS